MFEIVQDILDVRTLAQTVASESDGAIATFSGIVRGTNKGKKVLFLEYEAYPEMAVKMAHAIKPLGFRWVSLDLEGYRTGSLNPVLPIVDSQRS